MGAWIPVKHPSEDIFQQKVQSRLFPN